MHWWFERDCKADIDGNRGISLWMYQFGPEDLPEILRQIEEQLGDIEVEEYPDTIYIRMINPYTEDDVDIEINPKDYYESLP